MIIDFLIVDFFFLLRDGVSPAPPAILTVARIVYLVIELLKKFI